MNDYIPVDWKWYAFLGLTLLGPFLPWVIIIVLRDLP